VSLRLLYLIFDRLLNWLLLLGRTSSSKVWAPRTVSWPLTSAFAAGRPRSHSSRTSPPAVTGLSHWSSRELAAFIERTEGVYVSHHRREDAHR